MNRGNFTVMELADISVQHMTKEDFDKLSGASRPFMIATYDEGFIMYVPHFMSVKEIEYELLQYGLSEHFVKLFKRLRRMEIPYVRFDLAAPLVPGLKRF